MASQDGRHRELALVVDGERTCREHDHAQSLPAMEHVPEVRRVFPGPPGARRQELLRWVQQQLPVTTRATPEWAEIFLKNSRSPDCIFDDDARSLLPIASRRPIMQTDFEDSETCPIDARALAALLPVMSIPSPQGRDPKPTWRHSEDDDGVDDVDLDGATLAFNTSWSGRSSSEKVESQPQQLTRSPIDVSAQASTDAQAALLEEHARAEFAAGRYRGARALSERAMSVRRTCYGEADPHLPDSFCALGVLSFHLGRIDEATWHFEQAIEILSKRGLGESREIASLHNNLGVIARRRGDLGVAAYHYETALAAKISAYGWEHKSVALTLTNLGRIAELVGDLDVAATRYAQARVIAEKTEGAVGPALAASLLGIGRVLLRRDDVVGAVFALQRGLRIRESVGCTPSQLASARFVLALASESRTPDEARALVVLAIREYRAADSLCSENLQAMSAWLVLHDSRRSRGAFCRTGQLVTGRSM